MKSIHRDRVLNMIGSHFQGVIQWGRYCSPRSSENRTKSLYKAEALIEILEIADCGSIGGYDKGQPKAKNLFERRDWLYRKHNNPKRKRFACDIASYEDIKKYFAANAG